MQEFQISVPDDVIDDLRTRLSRTRFTTASDSTYWAAGVDPGYLRDLVAYWADGFDWRAAEKALNGYPQFIADQVHFVHVRGKGPAPTPLILSHGWPSSFVEMLSVVGPLTDPVAYGGDPADSFDVIIPSLPGFLYSGLSPEPLTRRRIAELWHGLMTETLGYQRFGAFGGDIGGSVTQWLGALYPENLIGVHLTSGTLLANVGDKPFTAQEQAYVDSLAAYDAGDQGYSEIMWTRPDTIAAALIDSPAGLLAWIVDKYRDWSDCGGDVESRWSRDTLLTVATLYWVTDCIGSSFRTYYDYGQNKPRPDVTVPSAVTLAHEPSMAGFPRSLVERTFTDLRQWSTPDRGGHFLAHEEPALVTADLRTFFGSL